MRSHPDMRVHKYGRSSWNAGMTAADQSDLPDGHKRCSKVVDPRCTAAEGIHPLDNYRTDSIKVALGRPNVHFAACRYCESYRGYQRTREPDRIEDYRKYQREYKRMIEADRRFEEGVQIIWDPTGFYHRNVLFTMRDFRETLADGLWPEGMYVRYLASNKCYVVKAMEVEEVEDRNWFEFIRERQGL